VPWIISTLSVGERNRSYTWSQPHELEFTQAIIHRLVKRAGEEEEE